MEKPKLSKRQWRYFWSVRNCERNIIHVVLFSQGGGRSLKRPIKRFYTDRCGVRVIPSVAIFKNPDQLHDTHTEKMMGSGRVATPMSRTKGPAKRRSPQSPQRKSNLWGRTVLLWISLVGTLMVGMCDHTCFLDATDNKSNIHTRPKQL